jgi:hypothetical protein
MTPVPLVRRHSVNLPIVYAKNETTTKVSNLVMRCKSEHSQFQMKNLYTQSIEHEERRCGSFGDAFVLVVEGIVFSCFVVWLYRNS